MILMLLNHIIFLNLLIINTELEAKKKICFHQIYQIYQL